MTDPVEWLGQWVSEADRARLDEASVALTPSRSIGVAGAVIAWREHIAKIDVDLDAAPDDRSVWGAHDLVAAVIMRDIVAETAGLADPALLATIEPAIAEVDEWFRRITEPDDDGCLDRVDGRPAEGRAWWWRRIPLRGPIREELRELYGHNLRP